MKGAFIQSLMTRTLDLVTGGNLKRWLLSAGQSSSIASDAHNNTNASRAKLLVHLWAENHEVL